MKIFIAYYYDEEINRDSEIYIGKTGTHEEFMKYLETAYEIKVEIHSIDVIYLVTGDEISGIDGKRYKLFFKKMNIM